MASTFYQYKSFQKVNQNPNPYNQITMFINFDRDAQIMIVSIQLVLFVLSGCLAVYKMVLSKQNHAQFLFGFYLFAILDILVYSAMMIYQLVRLAFDQEIYLIVLVIINVYSMIVEAVIIALLSFYWKQTEAILRGSGLDALKSVSDIKNELILKAIFIGIWLILYSTFLMYAVITGKYLQDDIYQDIFYFVGQGLSTFLLIWVNISQVMNARQFSFTLARYQSLVSYQMNKRKFRCIYWIATSMNFLRLMYLIASAIFFRINTESKQEEWIGVQIYTATAIIPLAIYIYSFQVSNQKPHNSFNQFDPSDKSERGINSAYEPPLMLSPQQKKKSKQLRESFNNETELSSSYDSHGGAI